LTLRVILILFLQIEITFRKWGFKLKKLVAIVTDVDAEAVRCVTADQVRFPIEAEYDGDPPALGSLVVLDRLFDGSYKIIMRDATHA